MYTPATFEADVAKYSVNECLKDTFQKSRFRREVSHVLGFRREVPVGLVLGFSREVGYVLGFRREVPIGHVLGFSRQVGYV